MPLGKVALDDSTLVARGYIAAVLVAIVVFAAILLVLLGGTPVHTPISSASDATGTVKWTP